LRKKARNAARKSATLAISLDEGEGSVLRPVLFLLAAHATSAGGAGEQSRYGRLDDRGRPVPARDELLEPVSLDAADDLVGHEIGVGDQPLQQAAAETRPVWESRCVDEAGNDRVNRDPAAGELDAHRAGEGELRVLRGAVGTRVPGRDRARDRSDVDEVGRSTRFERG
jgi:hypothetical protein